VNLPRLREGVYRFLGVGFSYPTAELLEASAATVSILDDLGLFDYAFANPVADAARALAEAELIDLQDAHTAMFGAGVAGPACSPHLTSYLADSRTGEVARVQASLRSTYRRFGFGDAISDGDNLDHIATVMEVMARLCADDIGWRANDRHLSAALSRQSDFFSRYLASWAPEFSDRVREIDRHPAYTALATAAHAFIEHERDLLPLLGPVAAAES
jgi:TorA maturation chaperone TorD